MAGTVVGPASVAPIAIVIRASRIPVETVMLMSDVTDGIVAASSGLRDGRSRDGADAEESDESAYVS